MCRVGGGPLTGGEQAPRLPKEIQQAWWTGWKKLHGLKWQTVALPNGCDFEVHGPASVRHNDNYTLDQSRIEDKLAELQADEELTYAMFGDSAYSDSEWIVTGDGRGMSSVREPIEWDYKDLKTMWKAIDYKHALKMRNQPISKIMFVCMLFRNAHNCMNGSQTSRYFRMNPPSFEEWVSLGPKAHPLPNTCIWSEDYAGLAFEEEEDGDVDEAEE
jgi:hypothetical protein